MIVKLNTGDQVIIDGKSMIVHGWESKHTSQNMKGLCRDVVFELKDDEGNLHSLFIPGAALVELDQSPLVMFLTGS